MPDSTVTTFAEPYPPRPGVCACKVCYDGYIRVPNFDLGRYVWVMCSDRAHQEPPQTGEPAKEGR